MASEKIIEVTIDKRSVSFSVNQGVTNKVEIIFFHSFLCNF